MPKTQVVGATFTNFAHYGNHLVKKRSKTTSKFGDVSFADGMSWRFVMSFLGIIVSKESNVT